MRTGAFKNHSQRWHRNRLHLAGAAGMVANIVLIATDYWFVGAMVAAAAIGIQIGGMWGWQAGADFGYARFLESQLQTMEAIEENVINDFAPHSDERQEFHAQKRELLAELEKVR